MSNKLNIVLAQTSISQLPEENLQTAQVLMQQASEEGADLIVFPEMFMAIPQDGIPLAAIAEPLDGPFINALTALAAKHSIGVICGLWETVPEDNERAANVAVALGPGGELLARYNKIHLFDALSVRESERMSAGRTPPPIFTLNGVHLGMAICYDLRFPELFRFLALEGADAVIIPSAWYAGTLKEEHWLTMLRSRAIENTIYTVGANLCGPLFAARSAVFDPFGVMLVDAGENETLVSARIETSRIEEVRAKLPTLTHVCADIFKR